MKFEFFSNEQDFKSTKEADQDVLERARSMRKRLGAATLIAVR